MEQDNKTTTITGNVVKYYGFYYPPVGIISILNLINLPWDAVFYIMDPILTENPPYDEISKEINPYVIISTHEGASHRWFNRLIPRLIATGVKPDHIILRSACLWDPDSTVKNIHTIMDECTDFVGRLDQADLKNKQDPLHHFVCLNRGHRWQRYQLVKEILDRKLDCFGKMSYIELPPSVNDPKFLELTKDDVNWHQQRDLTESDLAGALFNVITETAYEQEPESTQLVHHHRPGMTEKSYKCFALFQIPIWLAPYRAVECYRKLGFDVFDDIVDHGYDQESDPAKRIVMVADQVQKICDLKLTELVQLKKDLLPRFEKNLQILKSYAHKFDTELPQWQMLFSYNNPI